MINKYSTSGEQSPIMKDCNITVYNQQKFETVIARKNELYIPLIEEIFVLTDKCKRGDLFSRLEISFIKEILQKQYKYRLDNELLSKLNEIDSLVNSFNKIDVINIVKCTLCKGQFEKKLGNLLKLLSVLYRRQLFQVPLPSIIIVIRHIILNFSFHFF